MAKYYFHVQNDSYTRDDTGLDFDSVDQVRGEASDAAGEILTSELRSGKTDIVFQIQVEDDEGTRVMTLAISGTVATAA